MMKRLSTRSTRSYGIAYIFLIPCFAIIYSTIPEHFYQSTAVQEGKTLHVREEIWKYLYNNPRVFRPMPSDVVIDDTLSEIRMSLVITEIEVSTRNLILNYEYVVSEFSNVVNESGYPSKVKDHGKFLGLYVVNRSQIAQPKSRFSIQRNVGLTYDAATFIPHAYLSEHFQLNLNILLEEYFRATKGHPYTSFSSSFVTMLYFSTVTITTLGYGDIVPLTDLAKFLVALESLLGIILIGLFLNSIGPPRRQ